MSVLDRMIAMARAEGRARRVLEDEGVREEFEAFVFDYEPRTFRDVELSSLADAREHVAWCRWLGMTPGEVALSVSGDGRDYFAADWGDVERLIGFSWRQIGDRLQRCPNGLKRIERDRRKRHARNV